MIDPYLQIIKMKVLDNGNLIYSCLPKKGIKVMPTGYWATEQEAKDSFQHALIEAGYIT